MSDHADTEAVIRFVGDDKNVTMPREAAEQLVAERQQAIDERDALREERNAAFDAVGIPREAKLDDLIRHHRNNEAATQGAWKSTAEYAGKRVRELEARCEQAIDALREIAHNETAATLPAGWDAPSPRLIAESALVKLGEQRR